LLPLFACLCGNDYIHENLLTEFHRKLFDKYKGSKKNHANRVGLYLRDHLKIPNKENIEILLKEVFPELSNRKLVFNTLNLYNVKHMSNEHPFYDQSSIFKDELLIFDNKEDLLNNFKAMKISSSLMNALQLNSVNWPTLIENESKGSHHTWRFFRFRLYSLLLKQKKQIVEYYQASGSYSHHKVDITPLNEEIDFKFPKISFFKIWNVEMMNCQKEYLIPLICVLKNLMKLYDISDDEIHSLIVSLFIKKESKSQNIFISEKIQNFSSKFLIGMHYANLINDILGSPFDMDTLNLMYSGESFSRIFSILNKKESTFEKLIQKFQIEENCLELKQIILN
jgi:hypothetical protein